jgi:hypothetical protein
MSCSQYRGAKIEFNPEIGVVISLIPYRTTDATKESTGTSDEGTALVSRDSCGRVTEKLARVEVIRHKLVSMSRVVLDCAVDLARTLIGRADGRVGR